MAKRTILIFTGVAIFSGLAMTAWRIQKPANQSHSLNSPEGQAIHRSMMMQMQQQTQFQNQRPK